MTRGKNTGKTKLGIGALVLAGAAAFAYHKYSSMSEQEKTNLLGSLKEKGKKFYEEHLSGLIGKNSNGSLSHGYGPGNYQS